MLIGTAWMTPRPQSQYSGEPTRAILFMTREQAREWCKKTELGHKQSGTCCEKWKFRPVRVNETVVVSNEIINGRAEGTSQRGTIDVE